LIDSTAAALFDKSTICISMPYVVQRGLKASLKTAGMTYVVDHHKILITIIIYYVYYR